MFNTERIRFNASDLANEFDSHELQKGRNYQQNGKVTYLNISKNGYQINARVTGNYQPYYELVIHLIDEEDTISIDGTCSCPVEYNCKHVVAALYQALSGSSQSLPITSPPKQSTQSSWEQYLHGLELLSQRKPISPFRDTTQKLIYILNVEKTRLNQKTLAVSLGIVSPLKKGGWCSPKAFSATAPSHQAALTPEDELIYHHLEVLQRAANTYAYYYRPKGTYDLTGEHSESVLALILKTNRCYWGSKDGAVLSFGEPLQGTFLWESNASGVQQLKCRLPQDLIEPLATTPLWYLSHNKTIIGRIITDVTDDLAEKLMNCPPLLPSQTARVHKVFQTKLKNLPVIPKPKIFKVTAVEQRELTPCLFLYQSEDRLEKEKLPLAKIEFQYGNKNIPFDMPDNPIEYIEDDKLISIQRDMKKEGSLINQILDMELTPQKNSNVHTIFHVGKLNDNQSQMKFMFEQLPLLQAQQWKIDISENFPLQCVKEEDWYTDIEENSNYNWFGFELGIIVNNEKINIMPLLVDFIRFQPQNLDPKTLHALPDEHCFYLSLDAHRHIAVPAKRIKEILFVLVELYDTQGLCKDKLIVSRLHVPQLMHLQQALNARWLGGKKLQALGEMLNKFKGIKEQNLPKRFNGELRPYQKQGFDWLHFLREYQLGGILADDMGLGKTVQILAFLLSIKSSKSVTHPHLIVAPTSLMTNWKSESARFTPSLKVLVLQGDNRHEGFDKIEGYDLVLTTYPLLVRDQDVLLKNTFCYLILDEAQNIKNPNTKAYQVLLQVKAMHTLCMTGTPMENHLGELWSLLNFATPGLLGHYEHFRRLFRDPIEKNNDLARQKCLAQRVAPFMLRRTKEEVVADLPEKTEIIHTIELNGGQRDLYESIRLAMEKKVRSAILQKGLAGSQIIILDALLKLRQVCNDPRLLPLKTLKKIPGSAKLEFLLELLDTFIPAGRRILLFSSFSSMLALIGDALKQKNIHYVKLTGQTKDRATPIQQFQAGAVPIMLISLKAGGTGLNLTKADTVIHYDPWWNPAAENQATDRAHRIGQENRVFVYKLVCKGTVEEKILEMQKHKKQLLDGLFREQTGKTTKLSAEDLDFLFQELVD